MEPDLLITLGSLVLGGTAFYSYSFFRKRHDLILNTETSKISTLRKGFYEIKGTVRFLDRKLTSPLSSEACVYYKFRVEQYRNTGKSGYWYKIIDDEQHVPFAIEDRTGKAFIKLEGAKLKFYTDEEGKSGMFNPASESLKKALQHYNETTEGFLVEKKLRYKEQYLAEGDELYVLGEVLDHEGIYPVFSKENKPFIVSDKSEDSLIASDKILYKVSFVLMIILPLVGALLVLFAF